MNELQERRDQLSSILEAGRVLSKANEAKLKAAMEALNAILETLTSGETVEEAARQQALADATALVEADVALREAANLGNWLESRIHLSFTQMADDMFGYGRLSRPERIAVSGGIGAALDAFRIAVETGAPQLYQRGIWEEAPEPETAEAEMSEAAVEAEYVPLLERAVRRDGTIGVKIIAPGWGSSGYYPAPVLERDGPTIFKAGTKMYWDHPTSTEESERPERSLRDLAAELTSNARWESNHPSGPGLYADAKVFEGYRGSVEDMAGHIGVSIRAMGMGRAGEAEGRQGRVIERLVNARSVDFVTEPGAGGEVLTLFEAARGRVATTQPAPVVEAQETHQEDQVTEQEAEALRESNSRLEAQLARAQEALLLREARDVVNTTLATIEMPEMTRTRLTEALAAKPAIKEGALDRTTFETQIKEAAAAELDYLAKVAGIGSGQIKGMGASAHIEVNAEAVEASLQASFGALGLSESAAKIAASGR
jgi:hypothetical protein